MCGSLCLSDCLSGCVYVSKDREWVFDFGVKFYVPEPNVVQEEITRFESRYVHIVYIYITSARFIVPPNHSTYKIFQ